MLKKLNLCLTAVLAATVLAAPVVVQAVQNPRQPIIAQYFGIWTETSRGQTWEQKFRDDTPFEKLNRIYIAFGSIKKAEDGHFTLVYDGEVKNAQAIIDRVKAVNPVAEIFVSVGGDGGANQYGGAANDPLFADNVLKFLEKYHLDGIDVDWEMGLDRNNLNLLITHLATTLHPAGYKLTLAVWPYPYNAYDMTVLRNYLDQMNIMSYGKMRSLGSSVDAYVSSGFPVEKLIGGIEVEIPYHEGGADTLGPDGTITQKAQYALSHGLAGMMEWRLDNDYPDEANTNYPLYKGAAQLWDVMTAKKNK